MDDGADGFDLSELDKRSQLSDKLRLVHETLDRRFGDIDHVSVAVYDAKTDLLKTFLNSSFAQPGVIHYQARLSTVGSLQETFLSGKPRIVDDLKVFAGNGKEHSRRLLEAGYRSSYTLPMFLNGEFYGFIFFDSTRTHRFGEDLIAHIDPAARLIALLVINELRTLRTLRATVQLARAITRKRDCETGAHLDRMSRYTRLMAGACISEHGVDDEFVEHVFLFSPLHDIGKIAIPDSILLKPGPLTPTERRIMETHAVKGLEIIDLMIAEFELDELPNIEVLRNIVLYHHESVDGNGYPHGLKREQIPLEARITKIADMFDALTSRRPYKPRWSNVKAFAHLETLAGMECDPLLVRALLAARSEIVEIQQRFVENSYG